MGDEDNDSLPGFNQKRVQTPLHKPGSRWGEHGQVRCDELMSC
uniref:Uncharacterized protein n=1 Tax=Anguilla anguilla TaxID=7936 RepID=A0A0E9VQR9_ANGAN